MRSRMTRSKKSICGSPIFPGIGKVFRCRRAPSNLTASSTELASTKHRSWGFQKIEAREIRAIPVPASAFLDPFAEMPTLVLICNIHDVMSGHSHSHDPRYIAQKAEAYLQTTQIGDTANFGTGTRILPLRGSAQSAFGRVPPGRDESDSGGAPVPRKPGRQAAQERSSSPNPADEGAPE